MYIYIAVNQHGRKFIVIDFMSDAKFCSLNGRFSDYDAYTFISTRGKSVVDYVCVPLDVFSQCKLFKVVPVQSIVGSHTLHGLLGDRSRVLDHSVLVAYFSVNVDFDHDVTRKSRKNETHTQSVRFKLNKIPTYFMDRDISH